MLSGPAIRVARHLAKSVGASACLGGLFWSSLRDARAEDLPHPVAPSGGSAKEVSVPTAVRETPLVPLETEEPLDYDSPRFEPAAFPLIGGDSDIGFEFGAVGTVTRFSWGARPYAWNMDLLLAASVKSGPEGAEITQQNYLFQLDVPHLNGSRVRLNPTVSYERTVNQGYFGIGNASSAERPPSANGEPARYFQYDDREARVRELTRIEWQPPWDVVLATTFRYNVPGAYAGSKLAEDVAARAVRGYENLSLVAIGAGVVYDTRDNEYFPHRGAYHQLGVRGVQAFPLDASVRYGAFAANLARYTPIGRRFVFATRAVVDAQFGHVPFFDLYTGGAFRTDEMIGGSEAIRGVPTGRYLGPLKVIANVELRALFVDFHLLGGAFHLGGDLLFDVGRLWADYTLHSPLDGRGVGLKWGAGGGGYLVWGQAAVFRIDVAYSPDARSTNPNLPLGIYVVDGVMF